MKAIIFDLDGVLCYTDRLHYRAWKQACDDEALYFDEKINLKLRGVSRLDCVDEILASQNVFLPSFDKAAFASKKNELYKGLLEELGEKDLAEDVRYVLSVLKEKGILLAVGSSSCNAKKILNTLSLSSYFNAIVDGFDLTKSKPAPEVFIRAADRLGCLCRESLVVEDAKA